MALDATIYPNWHVSETVAGDLATMAGAFNALSSTRLTAGTGANQIDVSWSDSRTLTTGANEELDLNALADYLGRTANFVTVKALRIYNPAGNSTNLTVGNASATRFQMGFGGGTQTWVIPPGGWFDVGAPSAGWSSANGASDLLKITNAAGASNTYDIMILGTSA